MTTYAINGSDYPMALTLGAMEELDKFCGGSQHAADALDAKTLMETVTVLVQMLRILMEGGRCYSAANGADAKPVPSLEEIKASMMPKDIPSAKERLFRALAEGMGRTVDVEPDPKNAETTPAG